MSFSIGQRISNRDEDFIITELQEENDKFILGVQGVSELVKGKRFVFDTKIDDDIKILDPAETILIPDRGYGYQKTKLFIENQIRNSPIYSDKITIAQKAAFNLAKYQLEPTLKAFKLPRPRMLIADAVGLGKTVEVGIFLAEMIKRGKGKRIMVLALKSILGQFQQEIWNRFAIPLVRLDSAGISRIKSQLPDNRNPFEYFDKTIISIDTLKNNAKFLYYIEKTRWDIIVIDECHTVANSSSQRGNLAQLLSTKCESLIMTSATPHNGVKENFANLINMIEPLAISNNRDYTKEDIEPYYVRRFKNDIEDETVKSNFQKREVISIHAALFEEENDFLARQQQMKFDAISVMKEVNNQKTRGDFLFSIGLFKAYMSSPEAALQTIANRIDRLKEKSQHISKVDYNLEGLEGLRKELTALIDSARDAKYQAFVKELIRLHWNGKRNSFRIVVFAERIETLRSLKVKLTRDFDLQEEVIADFNGSLSDIEQQQIIEDFGKEDSTYRILLASDAGSQGVNLHYYCNHMFNYDIPWSLITLDQRNGRIDRYGQTRTPYIHYLIASSDLDGLKTDQDIVEKLVKKEQAVHDTLGDAASVFKLYDAYKEEQKIYDVIEAKAVDNDFDLSAIFDEVSTEKESTKPLFTPNPIAQPFSLFRNERDYYQSLISELKADEFLGNDDVVFEDDLLQLKLTVELKRVLYDMPQEAMPARLGDVFQLSLNKDDVQKAISEARKKKGEWAKFQMLYELHPLVRYLMTQLEASVDKGVALAVRLSRLPKNTCFYLLQGLVTNNLGQSLISDFFVMPMNFQGGVSGKPVKFEEFMREYNLNEDLNTEEITLAHLEVLQSLLPDAIDFAKTLYMNQRQQDLQLRMEGQMAEYKEKMKKWKRSKVEQLELNFGEAPASGFLKSIKKNKEEKIQSILDDSSQYYSDLTSLNGDPYLKVLAAFYRP